MRLRSRPLPRGTSLVCRRDRSIRYSLSRLLLSVLPGGVPGVFVDVELLAADGVLHVSRIGVCGLPDLELLDDTGFLARLDALLVDRDIDRVFGEGLAGGRSVHRAAVDRDLLAGHGDVDRLPFLDDVLADADAARLLDVLV